MINGKKEILTAAGIQADEALERLMGSEALLERFLKKFLQDKSYEELVSAIEGQELERAFRAAHTLKGVCGNLSLNRLGDLVKEQVELLRRQETWDQAAAMMPATARSYQETCSAIERFLEQ